MIAPAPYSIPGVGNGWVFYASINNIFWKQTDLYGYHVIGDAESTGIGLSQIPLFTKMLYFGGDYGKTKKLSIKMYEERGINSNKDNYKYYKVSNGEYFYGDFHFELWQKRISFYANAYSAYFYIDQILNPDETVLVDYSGNEKISMKEATIGTTLDFTDDSIDPHMGINFKFERDYSLNKRLDGSPRFYTENYVTTLYIPILKNITWAFNYLQSDAVVTKQGETDRNILYNNLSSLNCESYTDTTKRTECEAYKNRKVEETYTYNTKGTARTLGGGYRLRSYPMSRFKGAYTRYLGSELRWYIADKIVPLNLGFLKDIRTGLQLSIFYETGTVADNRNMLWKGRRDTYGLGPRMMTGSGLVYRFDIATGDEGTEYVLLVQYPW